VTGLKVNVTVGQHTDMKAQWDLVQASALACWMFQEPSEHLENRFHWLCFVGDILPGAGS